MKIFYALVMVAVSSIGVFSGPPGKYAITNVSVIPMDREVVLGDQTVLIINGNIVDFGRSDSVQIPSGFTVIEGKGKFLVPGLYDMHAHFYYEQGDNVNTCEKELKLMLANGITTARIQCGDSVYLQARQHVETGKWKGPELFISSPQLVGAWPWGGKMFAAICKTPEEAQRAVKRYKKEGYDEIKITFGITPEVYTAIVKTARKENIKVTGHVGPQVKLPAALWARQQNEHMDEFIDMLLPDTSYNHGQSVSDMNLWRRQAWETVPHLDERRIPRLVDMVKEANIYVTPTNFFFFSFFGRGIDEKTAMASPQYQFIPSVIKQEATRVREQYFKNMPPGTSRARYIEIRKRITRELWKAGVKLMAGSDSPQWYSVTGFALHDELRTMVECGLTPFAALQTATVNPATYLGISKTHGTIAKGKRANLILLNANPLLDITNTSKIDGVFRDAWYAAPDIQGLLQEARSMGK